MTDRLAKQEPSGGSRYAPPLFIPNRPSRGVASRQTQMGDRLC